MAKKKKKNTARRFSLGWIVLLIFVSFIIEGIAKSDDPISSKNEKFEYVQVVRVWASGLVGCDNQNMLNNEEMYPFELDRKDFDNRKKLLSFCPQDQTRIDSMYSRLKVTVKQGKSKWDETLTEEGEWRNVPLKSFCPIKYGRIMFDECSKKKP